MSQPLSLGIVIPTYNEAENIQLLLTTLASELEEQEDRWSVIIVDDNSIDGTVEAIEATRKESRSFHLIRRPGKMGLGSAYKDGFNYAIEKLGCNVVMEMDADLSHNPRHIQDFLRALGDGYQVVIGSRKVPGGTAQNWTRRRRLLSNGANWLARTLLGLRVRDVTSGFRAYTKYALKSIDYVTVRAEGFDFQVETLFRADRAGLRTTEIPIIFNDRKKARSKLGAVDVFAFMRTCLRLWNERFHH